VDWDTNGRSFKGAAFMNSEKIRKFMALGGQLASDKFVVGTEQQRKLGAQLLLSEVLEYVVSGLGVVPEFGGMKITDPNGLKYNASQVAPDKLEMLDGLADVAYTMYWNAEAFGVPLEEGFDLVCDNNLEKFVRLDAQQFALGVLAPEDWHCAKDISWPSEVIQVEVIQYKDERYAVGKDKNGKVRKPSSYESVDLEGLVKKSS